MILVVRKLALDTDSYDVFLGENEIHLTKTEFDLLTYLMQTPNNVISKAELAQCINKEFVYDFERYINVYICYLRKKIPGYIHTVRSAGCKIK